jgi:hypothetical protein
MSTEPIKNDAPSFDVAPALDATIPGAPGGATAVPAPVIMAASAGRYSIAGGATSPFLVSASASNIRLYVQRGLSVSEADRKQYPQQTVFLDGVYTGAPFLDNDVRHYSLDHHTGCIRSFTLATCEQAAVMLLQAMPLDEGDWHIFINEPDLDAVLAAWILLNHAELKRDNGKLLHDAMPLISVEGLIDVNGLEMAALSNMRDEDYRAQTRILDDLCAEERRLKTAGKWPSTDFLVYTQALLNRIDATLLPANVLESLLAIRELGRTKLASGKLAVWCESRQGIYAVEAHYRRLLEKQLAVILLDAGSGQYTLLQADRFLGHNLEELYALLNDLDPNAKALNNRWGGSADIGGSPRKTGTALSGTQLLRAVEKVYGGRNWFSRMVLRIARRP